MSLFCRACRRRSGTSPEMSNYRRSQPYNDYEYDGAFGSHHDSPFPDNDNSYGPTLPRRPVGVSPASVQDVTTASASASAALLTESIYQGQAGIFEDTVVNTWKQSASTPWDQNKQCQVAFCMAFTPKEKVAVELDGDLNYGSMYKNALEFYDQPLDSIFGLFHRYSGVFTNAKDVATNWEVLVLFPTADQFIKWTMSGDWSRFTTNFSVGTTGPPIQGFRWESPSFPLVNDASGYTYEWISITVPPIGLRPWAHFTLDNYYREVKDRTCHQCDRQPAAPDEHFWEGGSKHRASVFCAECWWSFKHKKSVLHPNREHYPRKSDIDKTPTTPNGGQGIEASDIIRAGKEAAAAYYDQAGGDTSYVDNGRPTDERALHERNGCVYFTSVELKYGHEDCTALMAAYTEGAVFHHYGNTTDEDLAATLYNWMRTSKVPTSLAEIQYVINLCHPKKDGVMATQDAIAKGDDEKKCIYMTECHLSTLAGLKFTQSVELAFTVGQIDWTTELHTIIYGIREYGWIFTTGWHPLRYMQMQHKKQPDFAVHQSMRPMAHTTMEYEDLMERVRGGKPTANNMSFYTPQIRIRVFQPQPDEFTGMKYDFWVPSVDDSSGNATADDTSPGGRKNQRSGADMDVEPPASKKAKTGSDLLIHWPISLP